MQEVERVEDEKDKGEKGEGRREKGEMFQRLITKRFYYSTRETDFSVDHAYEIFSLIIVYSTTLYVLSDHTYVYV